jgi:thiol-disulfide isomerase/thioredoxin
MNLTLTFILLAIVAAQSVAQTESTNVEKDGPLAIGSRVNIIKGTNFTGDSLTVDFSDGKLYLLDFWFYSCAPCRQSFPTLSRLLETYGVRGLVIIGVNPVDKTPEAKPRANRFSGYYGLRKNLTERQLAIDFGVDGYPTIFLIQNGEVHFVGSGYSIEKMANVEQMIKTLLK